MTRPAIDVVSVSTPTRPTDVIEHVVEHSTVVGAGSEHQRVPGKGSASERLDPRSASKPPEADGRTRDDVRLLVANPRSTALHHFRSLPDHLAEGDLVVVNTSATVPAALDGRLADGRTILAHVAGPHPDGDGTSLVELRRPDASGPVRDASPGQRVYLPGGMFLTLVTAHPGGDDRSGSRLWRARLTTAADTEDMDGLLAAHGRPIVYDHLEGHWPLEVHQPVFAREPGSAEMASAARPFTAEMVTELVKRGVAVVPVTLHTGVSSLDRGEPPMPERYRVPSSTATLVEATRRAGGRIVAVGTTVTRALETVASPDGIVRPGEGWTNLVLDADQPARVVTGLITGWHAPGASHLELLEAVAGPELVRRAYAAARAHDLLWHEFGDSCLFLP